MKKMTLMTVAMVIGLAFTQTAYAAPGLYLLPESEAPQQSIIEKTPSVQGCPTEKDKGLQNVIATPAVEKGFSSDMIDYAITFDENKRISIRTKMNCAGINTGFGDLFILTDVDGSYKWKQLHPINNLCPNDNFLAISIEPKEGEIGAYLLTYGATISGGYLSEGTETGRSPALLLSEAVPEGVWKAEKVWATSSQDEDDDLVVDCEDNCPGVKNPDQKDFDNDGRGDVCDPDDDHDGILDKVDNDDGFFNPSQCVQQKLSSDKISITALKNAVRPSGVQNLRVSSVGVLVPKYRDDFSRLTVDSDGDGVFDYLDKCAETDVGAEVDETGCPVEDGSGKAPLGGGTVQAPLNTGMDVGFSGDGDGCSLTASAAANPMAFLLLAAALLPLVRARKK